MNNQPEIKHGAYHTSISDIIPQTHEDANIIQLVIHNLIHNTEIGEAISYLQRKYKLIVRERTEELDNLEKQHEYISDVA